MQTDKQTNKQTNKQTIFFHMTLLTVEGIYIFWTYTRSETYARANNAGNWSPNHFVPLVRSSNNIELQHDLVLSNIAYSNAVSFTVTEIRS